MIVCEGWDPSMVVKEGEPNKVCKRPSKWRTRLDKRPYCNYHAIRDYRTCNVMGSSFDELYEKIS